MQRVIKESDMSESLIPLLIFGSERDISDIEEILLKYLPLHVFGNFLDDLPARGPNRDDHAPPGGKLVHECLRNLLCSYL
jgi:hypothetical protein